MSEDLRYRNEEDNNDLDDDAVCNIESYSEESGDAGTDPFVGHYGKLTRQV